MRPLVLLVLLSATACHVRALDVGRAPDATRELVPGFDLSAGETRTFPVTLPSDAQFLMVQHQTAQGSVEVSIDHPDCQEGFAPHCVFGSAPEPMTVTVHSDAGAVGVQLEPMAHGPGGRVTLQRTFLDEGLCQTVELSGTPGVVDVYFTRSVEGLDSRWMCGVSGESQHCQLRHAAAESVEVCFVAEQYAKIELRAAEEFAGGITDVREFDIDVDSETPTVVALTASASAQITGVGGELSSAIGEPFSPGGVEAMRLTADGPLGWIRMWSFDGIAAPTVPVDGPATSAATAQMLVPHEPVFGETVEDRHYYALPASRVTLLAEGAAAWGETLGADLAWVDHESHGLASEFRALSLDGVDNGYFMVSPSGAYTLTAVVEPDTVPQLRMVEINRDRTLDIGCDAGPELATSQYIEIVNEGTDAVNMQGFRLAGRAVGTNRVVEPGERFVVADPASGCALIDGAVLDLGGGPYGLNLHGEIELATPGGELIDSAQLPTQSAFGSFVLDASGQWVEHPGGFFDAATSPGEPH